MDPTEALMDGLIWGTLVARLRYRCEITQGELGEHLQVSQPMLSRLERGLIPMTNVQRHALDSLFSLTPELCLESLFSMMKGAAETAAGGVGGSILPEETWSQTAWRLGKREGCAGLALFAVESVLLKLDGQLFQAPQA